jgi:hypothetical protein
VTCCGDTKPNGTDELTLETYGVGRGCEAVAIDEAGAGDSCDVAEEEAEAEEVGGATPACDEAVCSAASTAGREAATSEA